MKPHQKTQVRVSTSKKQARALDRVAKARGISKGSLIREAFAMVTGVPDEIGFTAPVPKGGNFAAYNARRREAGS